jgi:hypothetical protein
MNETKSMNCSVCGLENPADYTQEPDGTILCRDCELGADMPESEELKYQPWIAEGITEADYWRKRYLELQQDTHRLYETLGLKSVPGEQADEATETRYPYIRPSPQGEPVEKIGASGFPLNKRELFAAMAMQGICSMADERTPPAKIIHDPEATATWLRERQLDDGYCAVAMADALLAALSDGELANEPNQ